MAATHAKVLKEATKENLAKAAKIKAAADAKAAAYLAGAIATDTGHATTAGI